MATYPLHTILLHHLQKLDYDFGRRSDKDLSFSALLSVGQSFKAISQHRHFRHLRKRNVRLKQLSTIILIENNNLCKVCVGNKRV